MTTENSLRSNIFQVKFLLIFYFYQDLRVMLKLKF